MHISLLQICFNSVGKIPVSRSTIFWWCWFPLSWSLLWEREVYYFLGYITPLKTHFLVWEEKIDQREKSLTQSKAGWGLALITHIMCAGQIHITPTSTSWVYCPSLQICWRTNFRIITKWMLTATLVVLVILAMFKQSCTGRAHKSETCSESVYLSEHSACTVWQRVLSQRRVRCTTWKMVTAPAWASRYSTSYGA